MIRTFMALALKANHFRNGSKAAIWIAKKLCPILNWKWVRPCAACAGAHPIDEMLDGSCLSRHDRGGPGPLANSPAVELFSVAYEPWSSRIFRSLMEPAANENALVGTSRDC
jgi:hypothetical protein